MSWKLEIRWKGFNTFIYTPTYIHAIFMINLILCENKKKNSPENNIKDDHLKPFQPFHVIIQVAR